MNREGSGWYANSSILTPTSARRRERESNSGAGPQSSDFDLDGFKRNLMEKFIEDTTAITQEQEDHKR